ncbi:MAG: NUDIX domain-containing protein [Gammaproteobacteria bacterium]|nr:NUDIX domain-containing protein [Gammaproteobacteria bacterium]MCP5202203.1 NUDIX domain-containing protein [Gammaproteobacteria bacterium]
MPPDPGAELLDVVDAADVVVGQATRAEIHRRGWRHRAVHIVVSNPQGEVFVQRRALSKDCQPGLWDTSAAGHVDHGESYAAAAARELAEELGLVEETLEAWWSLAASPDTGQEFVHVYRCCSTRQPRPDPGEIAASGWWTPAALAAWMTARPQDFTAAFRAIFARYRALETAA